MNYLAHLHLGGDAPAQLLGSLYGDFVKGPLTGQWPEDIEAAIRLHRRIDVFTDNHPLQLQARARFPLERRRYSGILLDIFFDHCLALHWADYASEPLPSFTGRVYQVLAQEPQLPERLAWIAPRMAAQDWLGSYREFAVLEQVVGGIQRRLSRPQGLGGRWWSCSGCISRCWRTFVSSIPSYRLTSPASAVWLTRLLGVLRRRLRATASAQRAPG